MIQTKEWLIAARKQRKITQKELAQRIGVTTNAISNIEQGQRLGSIETWNKINSFFNGINISYTNSELLEEIRCQISTYGEDRECYLSYEIQNNHILFKDMSLLKNMDNKYSPLQKRHILQGTLKQALEIFETQNNLL